MPDALVFWHNDCFRHDNGAGYFEAGPSPLLAWPEPHPEGADRIVNIRSVLERGPLGERIAIKNGRHVTADELELFHTQRHVEQISALDQLAQPTHLEGPTWASPGSYGAAAAAAGTAIMATEAVLSGPTRLAYALVRPPGHHAAPDRTDGGCLFNNAGVAAAWALQQSVERVAIVDWDAHHGNGTQTGLYERDDVLTISLHMDHGSWDSVQHPETGRPDELGRGKGYGFNLNLPLPYGAGNDAYTYAFEAAVLPALKRFQPELIICASGQDANPVDPNGRQCLSLEGFRRIGEMIAESAASLCSGRLVMTQEGGYARTHTAFCVLATLAGALHAPLDLDDPYDYLPERGDAYREAVDEAVALFERAGGGAVKPTRAGV